MSSQLLFAAEDIVIKGNESLQEGQVISVTFSNGLFSPKKYPRGLIVYNFGEKSNHVSFSDKKTRQTQSYTVTKADVKKGYMYVFVYYLATPEEGPNLKSNTKVFYAALSPKQQAKYANELVRSVSREKPNKIDDSGRGVNRKNNGATSSGKAGAKTSTK